jgi:hypothetical protein
MKKTLQYDSLIGIASKNSKTIISNNSTQKKDTANFQLSDFLYQKYSKINNIEVKYQIKNTRSTDLFYITKNNTNFGGGCISLPFQTSKVILSTRISYGLYTNTWIALQNRNNYMPKLIVNNKKYSPKEVNGAFLRYEFEAKNPDSIDGKPENNIMITAPLNPIDYVNSVVGIWFG